MQEIPAGLLRYIARFDRREFWLAHEELEEVWQVDRRDFFKGMIQIAAAHLHIERGNWRGARRLLRTGLDYMRETPARYEGLDVAAIRARAEAALRRVRQLAEGAAGGYDDGLWFRLAPLFEGEIPDDLVEEESLPYRVRRYDEGYRPVRRRDD
jgi:hypothetical protein